MTRGLLISAPASGVGKTTLTLALARAFRDRGLKVQCFKSGPDYIDPAFHAAATGRVSVNLDSWAMPRETIDALVVRGADADLVLAEGSMGIFSKLMAMNPDSGFMSDFVDVHVGPHLAEIKSRGIKVVANAGGLNPQGLARLLEKKAAELNVPLKVATVQGDDLRDRADALKGEGIADMFSGARFPKDKIVSINAYFGGFPIAAALDEGADVVITGRVVDSALVLGPLIHEFGWPSAW